MTVTVRWVNYIDVLYVSKRRNTPSHESNKITSHHLLKLNTYLVALLLAKDWSSLMILSTCLKAWLSISSNQYPAAIPFILLYIFYLALPCPTLPYLVLPYPTLPYLTLYYCLSTYFLSVLPTLSLPVPCCLHAETLLSQHCPVRWVISAAPTHYSCPAYPVLML